MSSQSEGPPDATLIAFVYDERPTLNLVRSLLRDARRWPNLAIWDQSKDALISRMRSVAATQFLEQGAGDVMIMVDHDIGWEPGDLEHLTRVCLDQVGVVGGVFSKRGFSLGVPIRFGNYGAYTIPDDRIVECQSVATGFMAVHRRVLEAMRPTLPQTVHGFWPFFETSTVTRPDGGLEYLSEDYAFCDKARRLGFRVWADLRPQLTHMGTHLFTVADATFHPPEKGASTTLEMKDVTRPCPVRGANGSEFEMWIDPDDHRVSAALIRGERWEPEVIEALSQEIRPTDTVVEIGAHIGYHTMQLAPRAARYVAVEPLPHLVEILRKNVSLAGLRNVDIWPMAAINDEDPRRTVRMLRDWANPGASHLLYGEDAQGIEVASCRLPDLAEEGIDVLKLDAEGAEHLILSGPRTWGALARTRVLVTEYCETQLSYVSGVTGGQYLDLLEDLGFELGIEDRSVLPKGGAYCNIMCMRREG